MQLKITALGQQELHQADSKRCLTPWSIGKVWFWANLLTTFLCNVLLKLIIYGFQLFFKLIETFYCIKGWFYLWLFTNKKWKSLFAKSEKPRNWHQHRHNTTKLLVSLSQSLQLSLWGAQLRKYAVPPNHLRSEISFSRTCNNPYMV